MQQNDHNTELKFYCIKYYVQTKVHERDNKFKTDNDEQSSEHTETDEDGDSDKETDSGGRFSFTRMVPEEIFLNIKR